MVEEYIYAEDRQNKVYHAFMSELSSCIRPWNGGGSSRKYPWYPEGGSTVGKPGRGGGGGYPGCRGNGGCIP